MTIGCAAACATGTADVDGGDLVPLADAASVDGPVIVAPDAGVRADAGPGAPDAAADAASPDAGSSACAQALAAASFDWESGAQGWTHARMPEVEPPPVSWTFDHWERGTATSGPGSCQGGSGCWATNLDGNYISCQRAQLVSPAVDLSACAGETVHLRFHHAYDFWSGTWASQTWRDGGFVELSADGTGWQAAALTYPGTVSINPDMGLSYACVEKNNFHVHGKPGFVGASGGWVEAEVSIPAALRKTGFRVRFVYASGVSAQVSSEVQSMSYTRPGWYLDDLSLGLPGQPAP